MAKFLAKANKKIKTPNYHAMVFAAIIIAMFFIFVNSETAMYENIVARRDQAAASVRSGNLDIEVIREMDDRCTKDMEELKERSPFGKFLADLDESTSGRIGNYFLVYAPRCIAIYLVFFIFRDLLRQGRIIFRNVKCRQDSKKQKESLNQ